MVTSSKFWFNILISFSFTLSTHLLDLNTARTIAVTLSMSLSSSSSSCPFPYVGNRALRSLSPSFSVLSTTTSFHPPFQPKLSSFFFSSLQISLGLPLLRLPSGIQVKAMFLFSLAFVLNTCPINFQHRRFICYVISSIFVLDFISSIDTLIGQYIFRMRRTHLWRKTLSLFLSLLIILHVLQP